MKKRYLFLLAGILIGGFLSASACTKYSCKAIIYGFRIENFEECAEAGFPIVAGDPPRCYLTEEKVYIRSPQHVRVTTPMPNSVLGKTFALAGEARAIGNQVFYVITNDRGDIVAEGNIPVESADLGRMGGFSQEITLADLVSGTGTLEVFEELPTGGRESVVAIPISFSHESGSAEAAEKSSSSPNQQTIKPSSPSVNDTFDPLAIADKMFPKEATIQVPFTPQAPFADWNPPYDEACEEASLIMVHNFLNGDSLTPSKANNEIVLLADWEEKQGYEVDITAAETAEVASSYYGLKAKVYTGAEVSIENIKRLVAAGYPVIIPAAGQLLGNPYFRGAGPPYHMLVITGYDERTFRTNDPGTKRGEAFEYSQATIMKAIHDWNVTKEKILQGQKAMLVVGQ